jgi:hypothetical protein
VGGLLTGGAAGAAANGGAAGGVGDCVLLERRTAEAIKVDLADAGRGYCAPTPETVGACSDDEPGDGGFWIDYLPGLIGGAIVVEARSSWVLDDGGTESWPLLCVDGAEGQDYQDFRVPATIPFNRYWIDGVTGDRWYVKGEYMNWGGDSDIIVQAIEFWECAP